MRKDFIFTVVLLAACGDAVAPEIELADNTPTSVFGTYQLRTIDGHAVPHAEVLDPTLSFRWDRAEIALNPDSTTQWSVQGMWVSTVHEDEIATNVESGTYSISGDVRLGATITFCCYFPESGGTVRQDTIVLAGDNLGFLNGVQEWVFVR